MILTARRVLQSVLQSPGTVWKMAASGGLCRKGLLIREDFQNFIFHSKGIFEAEVESMIA